jgi:hypothetical protein
MLFRQEDARDRATGTFFKECDRKQILRLDAANLHRSGAMNRLRVIAAVVLFSTVFTAQAQKFEVSPFVGGRFGGSLKIEQPGQPNFHANIADGIAYGVSGGLVIDGDDCVRCALIEFRWMRASTHLSIPQDPLVPTPLSPTAFRPSVTLDHFLGDFTREWPLEDVRVLRPFIVGTLGAVRMGAPASSATRFVFGIGTGFKVFPAPRWGIRVQAEYLPIVLHAELQTLVCAGGCTVVLNGGISNQFQVSVGPAFRF